LGALRFGRATIIDVLAAGLRAIGVGAVALAGGKSLLSFAGGLAVAAVLTLFVVKVWLTYPFAEAAGPGQGARGVLREALPFALTSLTWNSFTELPKIVLAPTAGTTAVGQFAAGARFLTTAYVPLQSLLLVITPRLFAFAREARPRTPARHPLTSAAAAATLAGGALAALVVAFAPLVPVLLGEEYRPAVSVLRILAVSLPFQALAFATGDWLGGVGRQQVRFGLTLVIVLLAVPVLILASKLAGPLGAAAGYTGLTALLGLATAVASQRYLHS
jgi:O-antigen/teichoic acid export membrane protein